MPRPTNQNLTDRKQLDQRSTFDSTTPDLRVTARPVNPIEKKDASSKAQELAEVLGITSEGIKQYGNVKEQVNQEELQHGMFLAEKGEDKPSEGEYLIKGYERMEGELHARKFARKAQQYYTENFNKLDPEEFNEGLKSLSQQYLDSAPSDDYLKSFIPMASQSEEKLINQYNLDMAKRFQEESIKMTSELISDNIQTVVEDSIGTSLENIHNDPMEYIQTSLSIKDTDLDKTLRDSLTNIQEKAKELNLSKQDVSSLFVEHIGNIAIETGMPELLDFASIEDTSNIRLETNPDLMEPIKNYRQKAEANRNNILEAQDRKVQKQREVERKKNLNQLTAAVGNAALIEDDKERLELVNKLEDDLLENPAFENLSNSEFKTYHDRIMKIKKGINSFRDETVAPVYLELHELARSGNLTNQELLDNVESLTQSDYQKLADMIDDTKELEASEEEKLEIQKQKEAQKRADEWFEFGKRHLIKQLQDMRGYEAMFEGDTDSALELRIQRDYDAITEEKGEPLTLEEIDKLVLNPIIQAETKYNSVDELASGESFTANADEESRPELQIEEGQKVIEQGIKDFEGKTRGAWSKITKKDIQDFLPEGYTAESFSPERQQKGIEVINKAIEAGYDYESLETALDNSQHLDPPEAKAYRDMYFYQLGLNMTDKEITGKTILAVQEKLRELKVPDELIKTIIMDLE